jgi:hypothetical protein
MESDTDISAMLKTSFSGIRPRMYPCGTTGVNLDQIGC